MENIFPSKTNMFCIEGDRKLFDPEFISLMKDSKKAKEVYSMVKNLKAENLFDSNGTHLLHLAAKYNNGYLILYLWDSDWDMDIEDSSGTTPLVIAMECGHFAVAFNLYDYKRVRLQKQLHKLQPLTSCSRQVHLQMVSMPLMKDLISRLRKKGFSTEKIGALFTKVPCSLDEIVHHHDAVMTKSYLQTKHWMVSSLRHVYDTVIPTFDFRHIQVLTDHVAAGTPRLADQFCRSLLTDICTYQKSKEGRDFLKKVFSFEIFDENHIDYLEVALEKASRKSIKIFLQYGFHLDIRAKYDRDILLSLFGNRNFDVISFLRIDKIDVDTRGIHAHYFEDNTLLHLAADTGAIKNIRSLLDRGADPNTFNQADPDIDIEYTPLETAAESARETCVKLLLLNGANPLLTRNPYGDKFFNHDSKGVDEPSKIDVIKLLAAHLAIYEEDGQPVERRRKAYKNLNSQELERFNEECRQQLKMLKSHEIRDTWMNGKRALTMFTILSERPEKIARFISEEDLQEVIKFVKCNRKTVNSHYREALKKYAKDIAEIKRRRCRAIEVVCELSGILDSHHLVVDKIVDYLSLKDLFYFK